jgi:hypothetical protein
MIKDLYTNPGHDIAEILLKVALSTDKNKQNPSIYGF